MKLSNIVPYEEKHAVVVYRDPLKIVEGVKRFNNRQEIKQELPEICGRVLARAWIDDKFKQDLETNIHQAFQDFGVHLTDEFALQYEKTSGQRAKITIYEQQPGSKFKLKVCSLTLTMMAQR